MSLEMMKNQWDLDLDGTLIRIFAKKSSQNKRSFTILKLK